MMQNEKSNSFISFQFYNIIASSFLRSDPKAALPKHFAKMSSPVSPDTNAQRPEPEPQAKAPEASTGNNFTQYAPSPAQPAQSGTTLPPSQAASGPRLFTNH